MKQIAKNRERSMGSTSVRIRYRFMTGAGGRRGERLGTPFYGKLKFLYFSPNDASVENLKVEK